MTISTVNCHLRVSGPRARAGTPFRFTLLIFAGGLGAITRHMWHEPEAEQFARIAIEMGVPADRILVENPAVARWILFGTLLIVLMNVRPQGLLGTARVEIV